MSIQIFFGLLAIITAALIIIWVVFLIVHKKGTYNTIPRNILIVITLTYVLITSITVICYMTAKEHGLYSDQVSITALWDNAFDSMPDQSELVPDEPRSAVLIMYRFDCETCTKLDPKLKIWGDSLGEPYLFVSTRSEKGTKIADKYSIDEVPCLIVFNSQGVPKTFNVYDPATDELDSTKLQAAADYLNKEVFTR